MKQRIENDKKSSVVIEINGTRVRVKGSNFYKKMMSRNTSSKLSTEIKKQGLIEGMNTISVEKFMELMDSLTSNRDIAYKAVKKAIKNGESFVEGIRTDAKDRSFIRAKLIKKGIIEEGFNLSLSKPETRSINISITSVDEVKEEEEELDW